MGSPGELRQRLKALGPADFDFDNPTSGGWEELQAVCEDLRAQEAVIQHADVMFDLMERLDGADGGSPGPLVHALESTGGAYEALLKESVQRKPTLLSVWMVNRILNTDPSDRAVWLDLLTSARTHPLASDDTRQEVEEFLSLRARDEHV